MEQRVKYMANCHKNEIKIMGLIAKGAFLGMVEGAKKAMKKEEEK